MKTIITYHDEDLYTITVDNETTLERIEMTFNKAVSVKKAVRKAKEYMKMIQGSSVEQIIAYITSSYTGEIVAEIKTKN